MTLEERAQFESFMNQADNAHVSGLVPYQLALSNQIKAWAEARGESLDPWAVDQLDAAVYRLSEGEIRVEAKKSAFAAGVKAYVADKNKLDTGNAGDLLKKYKWAVIAVGVIAGIGVIGYAARGVRSIA